jgi:hypothetical protein
MSISTARELFIDELKDIYSSEKQAVRGSLPDAALTGVLQRVEHYEISAYGTVGTLAEAKGEDEIHELLAETLQEEKDTDEKLTEISAAVNGDAIEEDDEEEDEDEDEDDDIDEDEEEEDEDDEEEEVEEETTNTKSGSKPSARSSPKGQL